MAEEPELGYRPVLTNEGRKRQKFRWYPIALIFQSYQRLLRNASQKWGLTGIDAAADAVETCSVSRVGIGSDATALVGSGAGGAVRATNEGSTDG